MGLDGLDWIGLSYTAVTPRASLKSDAKKKKKKDKKAQISQQEIYGFRKHSHHRIILQCSLIPKKMLQHCPDFTKAASLPPIFAPLSRASHQRLTLIVTSMRSPMVIQHIEN